MPVARSLSPDSRGKIHWVASTGHLAIGRDGGVGAIGKPVGSVPDLYDVKGLASALRAL